MVGVARRRPVRLSPVKPIAASAIYSVRFSSIVNLLYSVWLHRPWALVHGRLRAHPSRSTVRPSATCTSTPSPCPSTCGCVRHSFACRSSHALPSTRSPIAKTSARATWSGGSYVSVYSPFVLLVLSAHSSTARESEVGVFYFSVVYSLVGCLLCSTAVLWCHWSLRTTQVCICVAGGVLYSE